MAGTILIASDGRPTADEALGVGSELAARRGAAAELVAVLPGDDFPALRPPTAVPDAYALLAETRARDLALSVRAQAERVLGDGDRWPVRVETGAPAAALAARARSLESPLVVMGAEPPVLATAWRRGATALELIRVSPAPVLVVPSESPRAPVSAVAAIDFGALSLAAARAAAELLGPGGRLYLVHATWPGTETTAYPSLADWKREYDEEAAARLERIAEGLRAELPPTIEAIVEHDDAVAGLLGYADRLGADLVAAGSRGNGLTDPALVGGVAAELVRLARVAVLIAPTRSRPRSPSAPAGRRETGGAP